MQTKTLEQTPLNAQVAMGGYDEAELPLIIARLADRKATFKCLDGTEIVNGKTTVTNKGKVSLLSAVIDEVRSKMGLEPYAFIQIDGQTVKMKTRIPANVVESIKAGIDDLLNLVTSRILLQAKSEKASIKARENYLVCKVNSDNVVTTAKKSSIVTTKDLAKNSPLHKDAVYLQVQTQRKIVARLEKSVEPEDKAKLQKANAKLTVLVAELAQLNGAK